MSAGLFLVELGLTAAHVPRSAPVNSATLAEFPSTFVERAGLIRSERQTDVCETHELQQRLAGLQCDADYLAALQNLENAECSDFITFRRARLRFNIFDISFTSERGYPECGRDKNGILCGVHDSSQLTPSEVADVVGDCLASPGNCSDGCRTTLQSFAGMFDCCIHTLDITGSVNYAQVLILQLWSDCGVPCPGPCTNSPPELAPLIYDPSCDYTCTARQNTALFCRYQAAEVIRAYQDCGEARDAASVTQICGINSRGELCGTFAVHADFILYLFFSDSRDLVTNINQIYDKCIELQLTGKCPTECRDALTQARERFGCCFNNFNISSIGFPGNEDEILSFVTGYDLWSTCVIEPPSFCEIPSDTSVYDCLIQCNRCQVEQGGFPLVAVVGGAIGGLLLLLLVALVPIMLYYCCRKR